jgi:hypothetical protein
VQNADDVTTAARKATMPFLQEQSTLWHPQCTPRQAR